MMWHIMNIICGEINMRQKYGIPIFNRGASCVPFYTKELSLINKATFGNSGLKISVFKILGLTQYFSFLFSYRKDSRKNFESCITMFICKNITDKPLLHVFLGLIKFCLVKI